MNKWMKQNVHAVISCAGAPSPLKSMHVRITRYPNGAVVRDHFGARVGKLRRLGRLRSSWNGDLFLLKSTRRWAPLKSSPFDRLELFRRIRWYNSPAYRSFCKELKGEGRSK